MTRDEGGRSVSKKALGIKKGTTKKLLASHRERLKNFEVSENSLAFGQPSTKRFLKKFPSTIFSNMTVPKTSVEANERSFFFSKVVNLSFSKFVSFLHLYSYIFR